MGIACDTMMTAPTAVMLCALKHSIREGEMPSTHKPRNNGLLKTASKNPSLNDPNANVTTPACKQIKLAMLRINEVLSLPDMCFLPWTLEKMAAIVSPVISESAASGPSDN
jgi:hypothetical protein